MSGVLLFIFTDDSSDSEPSQGADNRAADDDDDVFSRLEESRINLEMELGEATFLKAYKIVQVSDAPSYRTDDVTSFCV